MSDRATPQPVGEMRDHVFAIGDRVRLIKNPFMSGSITQPTRGNTATVRWDKYKDTYDYVVPVWDIEAIATPEGGSHDR